MERTVTFKGRVLTLVGRFLRTGMGAPAFTVTSQGLEDVTLADFAGKHKVITTFPSLDTHVCDLQVKEFNTRAAGFSQNACILGISKDLPFAQERFCDSFDIKNIKVMSDYKTSSFGVNYGLLIKELNLLARSVIIIDDHDIVRYIQIVPELTSSPDYQAALSQLEYILKNPLPPTEGGLPAHCVPCEAGTPPLPAEKIGKLLAGLKGWEAVEGKKLVKEFMFRDFAEAKYFLDLVATIAGEQGHHPVMTINYNKVRLTFTTHAAGGLTENDFIMAGAIDEC